MPWWCTRTTPATATTFAAPATGDVALGDADGDGDLDVISIGGEQLSVLLNDAAPIDPPPASCAGLEPTIRAVPGVLTRGTVGDDVILGTTGQDVIHGGDGDDAALRARRQRHDPLRRR